ncbi:MAG TPA: hypothetical protein VGE72_12880, partial [Azospirillum sp.]
ATDPRVLAQAELARWPVEPLAPPAGATRHLDGGEFYGQLGRYGLSVAASYRFVTAVEAGDGVLTLYGRTDTPGLRGHAFWTALLAALLAGAGTLRLDGVGASAGRGAGRAPVFAPSAVAALDLDPAAVRGIERMVLRAGPGPALDADAVSADGAVALAIRGMAFRAVAVPRSEPAERRRDAL